jgi:hypothetical protein
MKSTLFGLLLFSGLFAQAQSPYHHCASAAYVNELEAKIPGLKNQLDEIAQHATYRTRSVNVTIPIVFHVVYKSAAQNIADSYLNAQVDLLNKSYARLNSDTTNMRSIYQSRVGASKVRFVIDQVIRVQTTKNSFDVSSTSGMSGGDDVKIAVYGGSDAVSPDKKLNIWVCNLTIDGTDGLIGYAYPPAGAPNWPAGSNAPFIELDGIVIDYTDVGGPAKQPIGFSYGFRGKALVHEVGHYLGLRHIWGDDNGACPGQAGYKDDGLSDTPVTADASNFDCNKTKNTCTESSGDLPDMVENYMDYSSESCQNSFTKMQVSAMEYVLDNIRTQIRVPVGVAETDELTKQITVYPNPATDQLYIDLNRLDYNEVNITLMSALGQTMINTLSTKGNNLIELNTSNFAPGIYYLNMSVDHVNRVTKKVIIQ